MAENLDEPDQGYNVIDGHNRIYAAIGRMTSAFAQCEMALSSHIRGFIGAGDAVGRVIVGGKRWPEMWLLLTDLMRAKGHSDELIRYVQGIQKRTGDVKAFRDWLAHNHGSFDVQSATNISVSFGKPNPKAASSENWITLSIAELDNVIEHAWMCRDLIGLLHWPLQLLEICDPAERLRAFDEMPPLPLSRRSNNRSAHLNHQRRNSKL